MIMNYKFKPLTYNVCLFSVKDPIPCDLRARVVYKFSCAGCTASYVGETVLHLATHVNEHLVSDRASHIYKHLERNETCLRICSKKCFQVLDSAATELALKIKGGPKHVCY